MNKILYIIAALIFITGSSCHIKNTQKEVETTYTDNDLKENPRDQDLTVKEFVSWCADESNKLRKTKEISDMKFNLAYLPSETMAFLELRTQEYDLPIFLRTKNNYSEMSYFNLKLEAPGAIGEIIKYKLASPHQYESRVKYMSFEMQNDVFLVQAQDTLHPGLFEFERTFEAGPFANFMLAFDNNRFDKNGDFTIIYYDKLFEKGFVKFNYRKGQLNNLPNITAL